MSVACGDHFFNLHISTTKLSGRQRNENIFQKPELRMLYKKIMYMRLITNSQHFSKAEIPNYTERKKR